MTLTNNQETISSMIFHKHDESAFSKHPILWMHGYPLIRVEIFLDILLDSEDEFAKEMTKRMLDNPNTDIEELGFDVKTEGYGLGAGYTYNEDNDLTRDILYKVFMYEEEYYTIVSIHYGVDARIGFGRMVCFRVKDIDSFYDRSISGWDRDNDIFYDEIYSLLEEGFRWNEEEEVLVGPRGEEVELSVGLFNYY